MRARAVKDGTFVCVYVDMYICCVCIIYIYIHIDIYRYRRISECLPLSQGDLLEDLQLQSDTSWSLSKPSLASAPGELPRFRRLRVRGQVGLGAEARGLH